MVNCVKIGIDFDRVLFQTDKFKRHLFKRFEQFEETYDDSVKNGVYNPHVHAELMDTTVEDIFEEIQKTSEFLYDDVSRLQKLQEKFEVVIVSRGDPVFQREKIIDSGVTEYVDDFHIVQDKPKDVIDIEFLVDDLEEEIERIEVPGFLFNREKHSIEDIARRVNQMNQTK